MSCWPSLLTNYIKLYLLWAEWDCTALNIKGKGAGSGMLNIKGKGPCSDFARVWSTFWPGLQRWASAWPCSPVLSSSGRCSTLQNLTPICTKAGIYLLITVPSHFTLRVWTFCVSAVSRACWLLRFFQRTCCSPSAWTLPFLPTSEKLAWPCRPGSSDFPPRLPALCLFRSFWRQCGPLCFPCYKAICSKGPHFS